MEAETGDSWIPGLAVLTRNDGRVVFVIPRASGNPGGVVQGGHFVSEQYPIAPGANRGGMTNVS